MAFTKGQVVYLTSGGPPMSAGESDDNETECVWFVGTDTKREKFPTECLTAKNPTNELIRAAMQR